MTYNVGNIERVIRVALGIALIGIGYFAEIPGWGAVASYVVGAVALVTGAWGFCPAWKLFGINTCATRTAAKG